MQSKGDMIQRADYLTVWKDPGQYTYEDFKRDAVLLPGKFPGLAKTDSLGTTLDGRTLYHLLIGDSRAEKKVLISGGIHGREYVTSQLIMKQAAVFLHRLKNKESYRGYPYESLLKGIGIHLVPMANPDGVTISQLGLEGIKTSQCKDAVERIALLDGKSPDREYLSRWKANANGVDLNRNFDARWEEYEDPAGHPSSDHYKGKKVGCEMESAALIRLTQREHFARTISYHAQGSVIYWRFGQKGRLYKASRLFADRISRVTGYPLDGSYEKLDFAGYKDWAVSKLGIPSLTIEVGRETAPVPPEQFSCIWEENQYVWEETLLDVKNERQRG